MGLLQPFGPRHAAGVPPAALPCRYRRLRQGLPRLCRALERLSAIRLCEHFAMGPLFVPETRVGFWFLGTQTWETRVIRVALADLMRLVPEDGLPRRPVVLDVGCGQGKSFRPLEETFAPQKIIAIDIEPECLQRAAAEVQGMPVDLRRGDLSALELADGSVDLIFCHQTFHHLTRQRQALSEFYRVLKPGGFFFSAESPRAYIYRRAST